MNDNEKLIEEAAAAAQEATRQKHRPTWRKLPEYVKENYRAHARAALAVFEKAHSPTDDEREALETVIAVTWRDMYSTPTDRDFADAILAAGFRRSDVPEPSVEVRQVLAWIDHTLYLPMYQGKIEGEYSEGLVDTLKTVRKMLNGTTRSDASWRTTEPQGEPSDVQVVAALNAFWPDSAAPSIHPWTKDGFADDMRRALRAAAGVR